MQPGNLRNEPARVYAPELLPPRFWLDFEFCGFPDPLGVSFFHVVFFLFQGVPKFNRLWMLLAPLELLCWLARTPLVRFAMRGSYQGLIEV